MYEDLFNFVTSALSKGSFLLRINNLNHFKNQVVRVKDCFTK